jgi:hypothetical protein
MAKAPELKFQKHIADFLVRVHKYGVLEQADISDIEHSIAEDQLWAFLTATQTDSLKKLTADYGTEARDEVFKALRSELAHTPLWMLLRHGLKVRALELRLSTPARAPARVPPSKSTRRTASPFCRIFTLARRIKRLISFSSSTACPLWRWS